MTVFPHSRLWSLSTLLPPSLLGMAMLVSCQNEIAAVGEGGGDSAQGTAGFAVTATAASGIHEMTTGTGTGGGCAALPNVGELFTVSSVASSGTGNQCVAKIQDTNQIVYEADCDSETCDCLISDAIWCACDNTGNSDCTTVCCPTPWGFH